MIVGYRLAAFVLGVCALAFMRTATAAADPLDIQRMVIEEAMNSRVPPALALAVAKVESNFQPRAVSPVGAKGVMQLMPKTARDVFGVAEPELMNPRLNILLGLDFLEQLYDQYGRRWDLALSHYNGGTLAGGAGANAVPHDFTRKYVADVQRWERVYSQDVFQSGPSRRDNGYEVTFVGEGRPFVPLKPSAANDDKPWRKPETKPKRHLARIDPLEFDDWAEVERRRAMRRRTLVDFNDND